MSALDYNALGQKNLTDKFWSKVNKTESCWLWTGKIDDGYGRTCMVYGSTSLYLVHRAVFAIFNEPIKSKMVIDHLCRVRNCCNPEHLRQVSHSQNTNGHTGVKFKNTCPNGHNLTNEKADVYLTLRKPRHGGRRVIQIVCTPCNYPQVAPDEIIHDLMLSDSFIFKATNA